MSVYIIGYILKDCPYSMMANEILQKNSNNKLILVDYNEKEKYKRENDMTTFPQIFFVKNQIRYKIGGYDNLSYLLDKNKLKDKKLLYKNINLHIPYRIFLQLLLYLHNNNLRDNNL
jgi:glutaredoxin